MATETQELQTTMMSLNEDCLRLICERLEWNDQMAVANGCQRLRQIIVDIWQHNYKKVRLTREQAWFFKDHPTYFGLFIRSISGIVEELDINSATIEQLQIFKNLSFPNTKSFGVEVSYVGKQCNEDMVITAMFLQVFPNLTSLKLSSGITGKFLWRFENLNSLDIDCCENLRTKHFKRIFTTLHLKKLSMLFYGYNTVLDNRIEAITQCETLEELCIDDHHLLEMIDKVLTMKNMRKLTVYTRDYHVFLLSCIAKHWGTAMDTMVFSDVFWSDDDHCEIVQKMVNLRRLIIHDDDIEDAQLRLISWKLKNVLEEFYYSSVRPHKLNTDGVLSFVENCENLKVLDISNTPFDVNFVHRVGKIVASQQKTRKVPLTLHCYGTAIADEGWALIELPALLKISRKKGAFEMLNSRTFQCERRILADA